MQFSKTVLHVGKYRSRQGTVVVTPERLAHWAEQFSAMRDAQQVVPVSWDHSTNEEELRPITLDAYKKRSAQHTIGRLSNVKVSQDGNSAEITVDLDDDLAVEKAAKNLVYVSPVIFPTWLDGAGNEYQDCFTHCDLVNHPVDHSQGEFTACAIRLGLSEPYHLELPSENVSGSKAREILHHGEVRGHKLTEKQRKMFGAAVSRGRSSKARRKRKATSMTLEMTGEEAITMADRGEPIGYFDREGDTVPVFKKAGRKGRGSKSRGNRKGRRKMALNTIHRLAEHEEEVDAEEPTDQKAEGMEGEFDKLDEVLDLLEANFQIVLPDDTTDENLLDRLVTALLTAAAQQGKNSEHEMPGEKNMNEEPTTVADPGLATFGLEARAAIGWAEKLHREQVGERLKKCLAEGRCTPAEYKTREPLVQAIKLSLDAGGIPVQSRIEMFLDDRDSVPRGTYWDPDTKLRLAAETVAQPATNTGEMSDAEAEDIASWALGRKKA